MIIARRAFCDGLLSGNPRFRGASSGKCWRVELGTGGEVFREGQARPCETIRKKP